MNLKKAIMTTIMLTFSLIMTAPSFAQDEASMSISRFVTCADVVDREPVGEAESFTADTEKVYAFMEALDISTDVALDFVWFHGEMETARVTLNVRQGGRWRTYSSKKIGGRTGAWRVEIQDPSGATLSSIGFVVN